MPLRSLVRTHLQPGAILDSGWKILRPAEFGDGRHSLGFLVESAEGSRGFLKAVDYESYLIDIDPAATMKAALDAFHDERRLLELARKENLGRVVRLICDGAVRSSDGRAICSYFIFELANSDATDQLDQRTRLNFAHALRLLHDVAVALSQLHKHGIAHLDVKPRNAFLFPEGRAKLGDLGKSVDGHTIADHVTHDIAGDVELAPPELHYQYRPGTWRAYRIGCDVYLLGSLITQAILGVPMTPKLFSSMPRRMLPESWNGISYDEILPALQNASGDALVELQSAATHYLGRADWADEIVALVRHLCDPDPQTRGCPIARSQGTDQYDLTRVITRLDLLARRAGLIAR